MQVRNGFMVVALVLAGGVVTMPALADNKPAKSATEGYQSAWQLWSKGDSVQAEKALQKLVVQFPQDSHLGLFLAASMAAHASEAEAETYFSRVIELGVKSAKPSPDALAAQHFLHLGDPDSANEAFSSLGALAQKNSQNPVFVWLYAQAAERMQKPELAEQAFKALLKSTKSAPAVVRQGYADALEAQGKHFFALEHRLKITSAESTPTTLHALSGNLKKLARFTEAASVAALTIKKFPSAPQGWYDLGVTDAATRRPDLAVANFSKAVELAETSSEKFDKSAALLAWGTCLESQKKYTDAAEKFHRVAALQGASALLVKEARKRARAAELAGSN